MPADRDHDMRTTLPPTRSRRARVLYAGVIVFVLLTAVTARSAWRAWSERAGQARASAVFDLVEQRTPTRPTGAPGATAWLREQLVAYRRALPADAAASFSRLADESGAAPSELSAAVSVMRDVVAAPPSSDPLVSTVRAGSGASRRVQTLIAAHGSTLVLTRRRALERDAVSTAFVSRFAPAIAQARTRIDAAMPSGPRPVRLYAIAEDGTLLSLPWPAGHDDPASIVAAEATQLASRRELPSFAPQEFFFTFAAGDRDAVRYSGFYLDLGGRGLVSTLTIPFQSPDGDGVLALDLAHAIDWAHFASTIATPLTAGIATVDGGAAPDWARLSAGLAAPAPAPLRDVLARLAASGERADPAAPMTHGVVDGLGAVAAFHVTERTWLLAFFPSRAPAFPWAAIALLGVMLAVLLTGFEANRRRAEREADKAARALIEKQNLLNTMQVPLMVVDPNTDEIVSSNKAASALGIRRGARFADRVSHDPRARAHYAATQLATAEPRRAYGVPIRVEAEDGLERDQFAIVRSVAVTAPIEALEADERHRLGILFLLDRESDLGLIIDDVAAGAHRDERKRLTGLLSHGLDALVNVLQHSLSSATPGGLASWLAEYLERRLRVTAWLLDHWDADPPTHDAVVDAAQAEETLASLARVFAQVRTSPGLRSRLGWDNGPLADLAPDPAFTTDIDWPAAFELTLPIRGGLGFFLTEALSNAMRHGAPATRPHVQLRCDRVRRELLFEVVNDRGAGARAEAGKAYGGLAMLRGMARLFGWREFEAGPVDGRFAVSWRSPVTRRDAPGKPD
jgi:hypothetical protein